MSAIQWEPCGYGCGMPWRRWAGSRLIGHARCLYPPDEAEVLLVRWEADPRLSIGRLAAELGVTAAVLRAVLAHAQKRRVKP